MFGHREFLRHYHGNKNYEMTDLLPLIVEGRASESRYQRLVTAEEAKEAERAYAAKQREEKRESDERHERERKKRKRDLTEQSVTKTAEIEAMVALVEKEDRWTNIERQALESGLRLMRNELRAAARPLRKCASGWGCSRCSDYSRPSRYLSESC